MTHLQHINSAAGDVERCCVGHIPNGDDDGEACYVCPGCSEHIRPYKATEECPGRETNPITKAFDSVKEVECQYGVIMIQQGE